MEELDHPFLNDKVYFDYIKSELTSFVKEVLCKNIEQCKPGHLFFGQRAFPFGGRDISFANLNEIRFYPVFKEDTLKPGLLLLIDETSNSFDVGIAELGSNDLGHFFERILVNISISKIEKPYFPVKAYHLEIFEIESTGTLKRLRLNNFEYVRNIASKQICDLILYNLERVSRL